MIKVNSGADLSFKLSFKAGDNAREQAAGTRDGIGERREQLGHHLGDELVLGGHRGEGGNLGLVQGVTKIVEATEQLKSRMGLGESGQDLGRRDIVGVSNRIDQLTG